MDNQRPTGWCGVYAVYARIKSQYKALGWRGGLEIIASATFIILLLNIIGTIIFSIKSVKQNGIGTLYHGDCNKVRHANVWIHLIINALSTVLLSGERPRYTPL
jgi:hypothetical protein